MKHEYFYRRNLIKDLVLKKPSSFQNLMQTPKINKIVIDTSTSKVVSNPEFLIACLCCLEGICGQKPKITHAKKSIANFKLRQNQILGCMLTLRKNKLYMFLNKLIFYIIPQEREFQGIRASPIALRQLRTLSSRSAMIPFQKHRIKTKPQQGTTALGLRNLMLFPETEAFYELFGELPGAHVNISFAQQSSQEKAFMTKTLVAGDEQQSGESIFFNQEMGSFLRLMRT